MSIETPFFQAVAVCVGASVPALTAPSTLALPGSAGLPQSSGVRAVTRYPGSAAGVYLFELEQSAGDLPNIELDGIVTARGAAAAASLLAFSVNIPAAGTYLSADGTMRDASFFRVVSVTNTDGQVLANGTFTVEFKRFPQTT